MPTNPHNNIQYDTIVLRDPASNRYKAFRPLTQLLGSPAPEPNYNVLPRLIDSLLNRACELSTIEYFDAFGLLSVRVFRNSTGVVLKIGKSKSGARVV